MFKKPFSFEGRIRRAEYGFTVIITLFILSACSSLIEAVGSSPLALFFLLLLIPIFWFRFAQGAKRCHDRGNSGWYQLIPFYPLWLLFGDGEQGVNEYGANPKNEDFTESEPADLV